nr:uncharacterized protein [Tanacetum cinerariifolium]
METRNSTELKKILDTMKADKRDMAQQMKTMQDQIQELLNSQTHGEDSNSHGSVIKEGSSGWRSNDIKVDIPEYDGKLDPDEFVEWIRTVERVFYYKETTDDNKVKIVALKLRKYASTWWSNASFSQLHSLKQGAGSAEDYSREFEYLLMKCDIPEDDPQTLVCYLGGLEPRVANVVELHTYQTLVELTILAHKVDSQQRSKGKQEIKPMFKPNPQTKSTIPAQPNSPITPKPVNINSPQTNTSKAHRRCFRCQGLGHIASGCPNKRLVTLTDFEIAGGYDFGVETSDDQVRTGDPDEEVVGPDDGELLVVRRALSSTPFREEKLQREAIFHTRCTVAQKVCSVIIDGGSCTNVASQTMVSKLGLLNEPHPAPYVIHWLNQGKAPMRSVQHKIDLIPGSALPNKPAYSTNPQETTEIQVDGLLEKGLIRESLSPFAVPTLLVPKKNGE